MVEGALEAVEVDNLDVMSLPFAIQEMVFAVWLIAKGLNERVAAGNASQTVVGGMRTP